MSRLITKLLAVVISIEHSQLPALHAKDVLSLHLDRLGINSQTAIAKQSSTSRSFAFAPRVSHSVRNGAGRVTKRTAYLSCFAVPDCVMSFWRRPLGRRRICLWRSFPFASLDFAPQIWGRCLAFWHSHLPWIRHRTAPIQNHIDTRTRWCYLSTATFFVQILETSSKF